MIYRRYTIIIIAFTDVDVIVNISVLSLESWELWTWIVSYRDNYAAIGCGIIVLQLCNSLFFRRVLFTYLGEISTEVTLCGSITTERREPCYLLSQGDIAAPVIYILWDTSDCQHISWSESWEEAKNYSYIYDGYSCTTALERSSFGEWTER